MLTNRKKNLTKKPGPADIPAALVRAQYPSFNNKTKEIRFGDQN
jgi:hypothetical protein